MATAQLLRYFMIGACIQGLATLPIASSPPSSPRLPDFLAELQEVPAVPVTMPLESAAARAFARLDQRLHARLDDCKQRYLKGYPLTVWSRWRARVENQKIEAGLIKLLERYPDDVRIGEAIQELYSDECVSPPVPSPAVLNVLSVAGNPVRLGLRLGGTGDESWGAATRILFAALALRPASAPLWMQAANQVRRQDWKIALATEGVESLAASGGGSPDDCGGSIIAIGAEAELELEVKLGLLARARRRLDRLPIEVRTLIDSGKTGGVTGQVGSTPVEGQLRDFRLDLALLQLVADNPDGAAPLLESARPKAPEMATKEETREAKSAREAAQSTWDWYQVLAAWREPSPQDPFEILLAGLGSADTDGRRLGLAALARRERYPAIAADLEGPVAGGLLGELAETPLPEPSGASWVPPMQAKPGMSSPAAPAPADVDLLAMDQEIRTIVQQLEKNIEQSEEEVRTALTGAEGAAAGRALSALIDHVFAREGWAKRPAPGTDLWIGEPRLFARMEPAQPQVVAWSPGQLAAEEKMGGDFRPHHTLELFVLDRTGHHGYAIWSAAGWGGRRTLAGDGGRLVDLVIVSRPLPARPAHPLRPLARDGPPGRRPARPARPLRPEPRSRRASRKRRSAPSRGGGRRRR